MEVTLTTENFDDEVIRSNVPVIVDFWATWCGPCQMIAPIISQIAEEFPGVKVGKVNVDNEEALAIPYGIASIPTILLFKDGKVAAKIIGYVSKEQIIEEFGLTK